jgi:hypothetical protein
MKKIFKSKIFRYILLLVLIVLFVIAIFWIREIIWVKKQSAINSVPEDIIQALQNEGYTINSIEYLDKEHYSSGPITDDIKYGYHLVIQANDKQYGISILLTGSWIEAKYSTEGINELDHRMNGGFQYAFYHGAVFTTIFPSDKEFGEDLYKIVKKLQ